MGDIFLFFTQYVCPPPSHVLFFIQLCNKFEAIFQLSFIFKGKLYQINSGHAALCHYILYGKKTRHHRSFQECLIFCCKSYISQFRDDLLLQLFVAGKEGVRAGLLLFEHTCFFRVLQLLFIPFCCLLFQFLVFSCNLIAYM